MNGLYPVTDHLRMKHGMIETRYCVVLIDVETQLPHNQGNSIF